MDNRAVNSSFPISQNYHTGSSSTAGNQSGSIEQGGNSYQVRIRKPSDNRLKSISKSFSAFKKFFSHHSASASTSAEQSSSAKNQQTSASTLGQTVLQNKITGNTAFSSMLAMAEELQSSRNKRDITVEAIYRQIIGKTPPGLPPLNTDQQKKLINGICQLEKHFSGQVEFRSQAQDNVDKSFSFSDFTATAGNQATQNHIRLIPWKGPKHSSVTSRLNINIKPEYAERLTEALAQLCASGNKKIVEAKIIAPREQGQRIESAALYLKPDLNNASAIASQLKALLPAEAFVSHTPIGMHSVATGLSYSENSSKNQISNGSHSLERAMIIKSAFDNSTNIPLADKLSAAFNKAGYQSDNPALVKK